MSKTTTTGLIRTVLLGAFVLTLMTDMTAWAEEAHTASLTAKESQAARLAAVETRIAYARAALRLTPAQARHWPRAAAAIRSIAQQNIKAVPDGSAPDRPRRRSSSLSQAAAVARVLAAAAPLIKTLNAEQKHTARDLVRSIGYGHLASRL
jgi:hypothetical protein